MKLLVKLRKILCAFGAVATLLVSHPATVAADAPAKKIVIIAGPKSHGPEGNRIHDYPWSTKLLKVMLDNSNVAGQVAVEMHFDGWPQDPETLNDADTIMVISDGRDGDKYSEAPHFASPENVALMKRQIQRGCGFVTFHFSTFAPDKYAQEILDWNGGYFDWEEGGERKWYSAIQTKDAQVDLPQPEHPIARGVRPFQMKEEFYYNIRFDEASPATPILEVPALPGREDKGKVVAWARQRPGGGRGFGTTCGHFYDNWKNDDFRRTVLNAICWTANLEVPDGGVESRFYTHDEITRALEGIDGTAPAKLSTYAPEEKIKAVIVTGHQYPGHPWRETTLALEDALRVDDRLEVKSVPDVEFLAKQELHEFDVVLLNYCNWKQPGLSEAAKKNFVEYLENGGGLVIIHFTNGAFHYSLPEAGDSDWPEWRTKICRRVWDHSADANPKSGHDAYGEFRVEIADREHSITRDLEPFETTDELYYHQQGTEPIHVLATAHSKNLKQDAPMAFVYRYGGGRVFQTVLGHDAPALRTAGTSQLVRRGVVWAAGVDPGEVKPPEATNAEPKPSPKLIEGKFGAALDARTGGLEVAADDAFHKPPFAVECWARLFDKSPFNILVAKNPKTSGDHWEIYTYRDSGEFSAYLPGYAPAEIRSGVPIVDGKWHHVAMSFDGAQLRLYVDGILAREAILKRTNEGGPKGPLWIGAIPPNSLGCQGLIDEVRVTKGAIEFAKLPDKPAEAGQNTLGLWRFDKLEDDTSPDASAQERPAKVVAVSKPTAAGGENNDDHFFGWKESEGTDARWQQMNTGPFFSGTIPSDGQRTIKGIAIRVGDQQQAAVMYDTEMLRASCGWTGEFLRFHANRFGLSTSPVVAGSEVFRTPASPGWSHQGSFADPRPQKPWGPLPQDWAHYKGLHLHGNRVVLEYTVGATRILESPWLENRGQLEVLTRTVQLAADGEAHEHVVCATPDGAEPVDISTGQSILAWKFGDRIGAVGLAPQSHGQLQRAAGNKVTLSLPAADAVRRSKLLFFQGDRRQFDQFLELVAASPAPEDLQALLTPGPARWTEPIVTCGKLGEGAGAYVVDTLTLPFENPYNALFFCTGHDFFSNGDAAVCTVHGDVWRVSGIDDSLENLRWKRLATGLFQPLGLNIVDDKVYVLGRDQISILHDKNGDDEADYYENFNNDGQATANTHEYATCLETDSQGNFYYLRGDSGGQSEHDGCLLKVSADGSKLEVFATGFRNANGMGIGPDDVITVAPQEGNWTPGSAIFDVKPGGFYGMMDVHHRPEPPQTYEPPICWIPRPLDNSSGGQVWAEGHRWGPLSGKMLHLSFGRSSMMLVLQEEVDGVKQGGIVPLPLEFESGVCRGRFHPGDGQLYVTGTAGWVTNAVRDGCFQRVRYTGQPAYLPTGLSYVEGGVLLTFTQPLDRQSAEDVGNYAAEQWNYRWRASYGSPDYKVSDPNAEGRDAVDIRAAKLLADGKAVFLAIDGLQPVMQLGIEFTLKATDGTAIDQAVYGTIHRLGESPIDASSIATAESAGQLDAETVAHRRPGLLQVFSVDGQPVDARTSRLAAWFAADGEHPSTLLAARQVAMSMTGFLKVDRKGEIRFHLEDADGIELLVNGAAVAWQQPAQRSLATSEHISLHKGYNRLELRSSTDRRPQVRLLWSSREFATEPIPATALFHDGRNHLLGQSTLVREGRHLFAVHRCASCHATELGNAHASFVMPTLGAAAPSLQAAGSRLQENWIKAWLLQPDAMRDDTRMPKLFDAEQPESRQLAADIAAYLASLQAVSSTTKHPKGDAEAGEILYEDLGCIQCHRFTPPGEPDDFDRLSLRFVGSKFRNGRLASFLQAPTEHYSLTRMPDFRLTPQEAANLAAFLQEEADSGLPELPAVDAGDVARGRRWFSEMSCLQCHRLDPQATLADAALHTVFGSQRDGKGCLASTPVNAHTPDFRLDESDRKALHAFLASDGASLSRHSAAEASTRWFTELRCHACHNRDGRSSPASDILFDEGIQGFPAERLPDLTNVGDKLRRDWMHELLSGELDYRARPWLRTRMPSFPGYADVLANGLAAEHGLGPAGPKPIVDSHLATIGERLTLKEQGLDCRQCHGLETITLRQDNDAQGISFLHMPQRLREGYYRRWMFDPLRIDPATKMPKFLLDGQSTPATAILEGDADRQFRALWHYIHSVPTATTSGNK